MDIRSDRQKGLSYVELGRQYHMDPRTAKRYAESPQKPEDTLSEPKPTKMDPYKQIVDEWLLRRLRVPLCRPRVHVVLPAQLHIAQSFLSVTSDIHPLCSFHFLTPFPGSFSP